MKIGYFITARLKSSRLKKKIVLPLNGKTVLDHVISRCQSVSGIDEVVLCTSTNSQDSELYDYALNNRIKFYIGSEDDVLVRLLDAAKYYSIDAFVSITADNPLHSIEVANHMVNWAKKEPIDFMFTSGLPIGLTPYYINTKALEIAVSMKQQSDTEIWGPFVNRPDFFSIGYLNFKHQLFPEETRLTCDYEDDYKLIKSIFNHFPKDYNPSLQEVSKLIKDKSVILNNTNMVQASVPDSVLNTIKNTFNAAMEVGLEKSKELKHDLVPANKELYITL